MHCWIGTRIGCLMRKTEGLNFGKMSFARRSPPRGFPLLGIGSVSGFDEMVWKKHQIPHLQHQFYKCR